MDFLTAIRNDPGALIVGAMWGIYVLGSQIRQGLRNNRQQKEADLGTSKLNEALQTAYKAQNDALREERDRADRLASALNDVSGEIGSLRAAVKYLTEDRDELKLEVVRLTATIEQLVVENRNKDKSITQLVDLNRKILRSIGGNTDLLEPVQLENENGPEERLGIPEEPRKGIR